ncbi:MAG: polynucleotide adenylyltransferase PcnB [Treponema sp.]|jgi:poly(A) polymerase|nr:polynucleotide adenylyltransferase PcnB [Treponema sp.]
MLVRYSSNENGKLVKKAIIYTKKEHSISNSLIDTNALKIISQLRAFGHDAYIVGGAVRDLLCNKIPKDFDIVTDATPSKIRKIFRNSRIIGRRFRLVHIYFDDIIFEVSTFRSTINGSIGNSFGSIEEDVKRRDFTLNALYYDPLKKQIIDYVGGMKDIKKNVIKPVIPLNQIFTEDPVRMLRAVKYAVSTGFKMPLALKRKIKKNAHLLSPISASRLTEEMLKILNSGYAYEITYRSLETNLFMHLQPSATTLIFDNKEFETNYLNRLKELDALHFINPEARLGEKLFYIIYDFALNLTDWERELQAEKIDVTDLYKKTWKECRHFLLPMNPQRTELDYAVNLVLKKIGFPAFQKKKRKKTVNIK